MPIAARFMLCISLAHFFLFCFTEAINDGMVEVELSNDVSTANGESSMQTYIVHLTKPQEKDAAESTDLGNWYESFFRELTLQESNQQSRMVHSYKNVITGFAAKLTAEEAKAMEAKEGVLLVSLDEKLQLHTTHSPQFLGLNQISGLWKQAKLGEGVIIGIVDTGIKPDHPSFSDEGMPPPPAKWKGVCEFNGKATCNNKLIGARNLIHKGEQPFDDFGHGTHTASTAAGSFVKDANVFGDAIGTAAGIAPKAHVAMYKVCFEFGCSVSAIIAGMDAAVGDGVDILSLSLGGPSVPFYRDFVALSAFGAIQRGVVVSCSAGNFGPTSKSLVNEAPWILTVGASTTDRTIAATVRLGNGEEYIGETLFQSHDFPSTQLPLVNAAVNGTTSHSSAFCYPVSLNGTYVEGKIVLCVTDDSIRAVDQGQAVKDAGGAAMILMNDELKGFSILAEPHVLPAAHVSYAAGSNILAYINSTSSPTATIVFNGTVIGNPLAPQVSYFSSRGPNQQSPGILKPDIVGPGVNILAAWPVSVAKDTSTKNTFNIVSGTSMSCPHLAGVAALLKSTHPDWSPSSIKSAIMTTADLTNLGGNPIIDERHLPADVFTIGAGHVNPSKANDPGLLYDIKPEDYIPYLCGLNYTDTQVSAIINRNISCSIVGSIPEAQLNYPAFAIRLGSIPQKYTRTITNIGDINTFYNKNIIAPEGVDVDVSPDGIEFGAVNLTATYIVTFTRNGNASAAVSHGYIKWESTHYSVKIPIVVTFE